MQVKILLTTLLLLVYCNFSSSAQQPYYNQRSDYLKANSIWTFGVRAGLDFNSGTPVSIPSAVDYTISEGGATVSDPVTGKLLFYNQGGKCWNKNDQLMPNGIQILGAYTPPPRPGRPEAGGDAIQGACIVPFIDSPGKYYLFSLRSFGKTPSLYYSVVDMSLDNGLGDIDTPRKNIVLDKNPLSEAMIAVPGDQCDIWLLVHDYTSHAFKAYHITANGIDTTPVISYAGLTQGAAVYAQDVMAIAPDRHKLALTNYVSTAKKRKDDGAYLCQFDPATGQVSDAIKIFDDTLSRVSGVCFSPDNSKVYLPSSIVGPPYTSNFYQFDVSVHNAASIANSRVNILTTPSSDPLAISASSSYLRLYNDTIYINQYGTTNIRRIENPNMAGTACGVNLSAITLNYGLNSFNLGNDVVYPFSGDTVHHRELDTTVCVGTVISVQALSEYSGYVWDDSSTSQMRTINRPGTYWVLSKNGCHSRVDTFIVNEADMFPVIAINVNELSVTGGPYASYQWLLNKNIIPGATQSTYTVSENGSYQVIVSNEIGCIDTSAKYEVNNYTGTTDIHLPAKYIKVYPNPADDAVYIQSPVEVNVTLRDMTGRNIREIKDAHSIAVKDLDAGIYLLQIRNKEGLLMRAVKVVKQ